MSKRVLQVLRSLGVGGLEKVSMDIFREMRSMNVEVDFLVFEKEIGYYESEIVNSGGRVFHINPPSLGYVKFYNNIKRVIRNNGPYDIVYSHTYFNSGIVLCAAKQMKINTCVAHCHSSRRNSDAFLVKRIYNAFMRKLVNKYADIICACSEQAGENMFGISEFKKRGIVLPNRIKYEDFEFNINDRISIRKFIGCSDDKIVFGTVGHLTSAKNHSLLLRLFSNLYKDDDKHFLLIVGEGELRSDLELQAKTLNIDKQVKFLGMRTDIGALLSAFDLFILTSSHEGLGIVLLEAQANGLPCVGLKKVIAKEAIISPNFELVNFSDDFEDWKNNINSALRKGRLNKSDVRNTIAKIDLEFKNILCKILTF